MTKYIVCGYVVPMLIVAIYAVREIVAANRQGKRTKRGWSMLCCCCIPFFNLWCAGLLLLCDMNNLMGKLLNNTKMEMKIIAPKGMEIDRENSTFECIKFKPVEKKKWRGDKSKRVDGYFINAESQIDYFRYLLNEKNNHSVFATEKQAKSALAMAQISQIMANDERFGGAVTDEEWKDGGKRKCVIERFDNDIINCDYWSTYYFLAFHTNEQRVLFLKENEDLVRDYLML